MPWSVLGAPKKPTNKNTMCSFGSANPPGGSPSARSVDGNRSHGSATGVDGRKGGERIVDPELAQSAGLFEQQRRAENKGKPSGEKLAAASSYGTSQLAALAENGTVLTVDQVKAG